VGIPSQLPVWQTIHWLHYVCLKLKNKVINK
jgi:hypothetical protein